MIDSHCHLLPGLDDGARSIHEAVQMARRLAEAGVGTVVCTPHYSSRFPTAVDRATKARASLAAALEALDISLRLVLAAELAPEAALHRPLEELHARTFGPRHLLVELQPATTPRELHGLLARVLDADLVPILGHPERCEALQQDLSLLSEAKAAGALVQVVAPSLVGRGRAEVGRTAWEIIARGQADLLGSDAHRPDNRRLQLDAIVEVITARTSTAVARHLTKDAAADLLRSSTV